MSRLEWERLADGSTSQSEVGDVQLRVERDRESVPEYIWEVRGCSRTREGAFDQAERAAIGALRVPMPDAARFGALFALTQSGRALLMVDGRPESSTLLSLIKAAIDGASEKIEVRIPKTKRQLSDLRRPDRNVVKLERK